MSAQTGARAVAEHGVSTGEKEQLQAGSKAQPGGGWSTATAAITHRELSSLFYSWIAYILGFLFLSVVGVLFYRYTLVGGQEASMQSLFNQIAQLLVFVLPLLTMKAVSEEFASGSIETLMTAPVTDASVVVGKFLGVFLLYLGLLATTIIHVIILSIHANPIASVTLTGYLGLILLGAAFISVGVFASTCTRHQLLAAVIAIGILGLFVFGAQFGTESAGDQWVREVCSYVNVMGQFSAFSAGKLDFASMVFFASITGFFLFLASKVLESRRWR